jgi:hypothetical protein
MPTYTASARGHANATIANPTVYSTSLRGHVNLTVTEPGTSGGTTTFTTSDRGTVNLTLRQPTRFLLWHFVGGVKRPFTLHFGNLATTAGAKSLGTASYDIPTTGPVIYVDPVNGSDSNSGAVSAPRRTAASASESIKAFGNATTPATVVLRGGTYHEGAYQPGNGYFLRWQSYPGEVVWFDGSSVFTGSWTNNGNGTYTTAYTAPSIPGLGTDKIGADPNALLPDQCFLDGVELYQAADGATPTAGQFSVNRGSNTLTVYGNPAGHEVRYSDLVYLLTSGSRLDLLGLGIRRYRCAGNSLNAGLYYGGTSSDTVIENVHFEQMGRTTLYLGKDRARLSRCTFLGTGQTAVLAGAGNAIVTGPLQGLIIERCRIENSNTGKWNAQPTSGAVKITAAQGSIVRNNYMAQVHGGNLLWWDVSCSQIQCYGNYLDGTSKDGTTYADSGICYEECDGGLYGGVQYKSLIVGNTVVNCHKAIVVDASGQVIVGNNTIGAKWTSTTAQALLILQDRDINHGGQVPAANIPWWTTGVVVLNNRILPQPSGWQMLAYDSQGEIPRPRAIAAGYGSATGQQVGGAMLEWVEGNWFSPAGGAQATGIMASVGKADGGRTSLNTPAALATTNATYGLSGANIGANYQSATEPTSPTDHNTAAPIPSGYAALLGVGIGTRHVGNPLPIPTLESA